MSCGVLCILLAIGRDLSHSVDHFEGKQGSGKQPLKQRLRAAWFWDTDRLSLPHSDTDDAGDGLAREHELSLCEDLVNWVVAAHTAIDEWLAIDINAFEERRSSGGGASGLPYHAIGGVIFGTLVRAEKPRDSGMEPEC